MLNPTLGAGPLFAPTFLGPIVSHIKEHIALWYMQSTLELADSVADNVNLEEVGREDHTKADRQAYDRMLAEASTVVSEKAGEVFADMPPIIEQAQKMMQQYAPPPPMDPSQVAMQTSQQQMQLEGQRMQLQTQRDQAKVQLDGQKLQQDAAITQAKMQMDGQKMQQDATLEAQKLALQQQLAEINAQMKQAEAQQDMAKVAMQQDREDERTAAEIQSRMAMNQADNQTAMTLAEMEALSGEKFSVSTGTGINP
jgi:hypothetical protein